MFNDGVRAYETRHFVDAAVSFKRALGMYPQFVDAGLYLGAAYSDQHIDGVTSAENEQLRANATQAFEDVLTLNPRNVAAVAGLANLYMYPGQLRKSREYVLRHTQITPQDRSPYR